MYGLVVCIVCGINSCCLPVVNTAIRNWRRRALIWPLFMSGSPAAAVSGAAQPGDQSALPGRHQPDCTERFCPALPVAAGKRQCTADKSSGGFCLILLLLALQKNSTYWYFTELRLSSGEAGINSAGWEFWPSEGNLGRGARQHFLLWRRFLSYRVTLEPKRVDQERTSQMRAVRTSQDSSRSQL